MKQLTVEDILKLAAGSTKFYKFNLLNSINSIGDLEKNLTLIEGKNKKERLNIAQLKYPCFFIVKNKNFVKNTEILGGSCAEHTAFEEFESGKVYILKVGDPFKLRVKCLGEFKNNLGPDSYLVFQDKENFYFFSDWNSESNFLSYVEIIK